MNMRLKTILDSPSGFRFVFDKLRLQSSLSRHLLTDSLMPYKASEIEEIYNELEEFNLLFSKGGALRETVSSLQIKLIHLRDIRNTISRLSAGATLDDIELFEIKNLAIINEEVRYILQGKVKSLEFESLEQILELL